MILIPAIIIATFASYYLWEDYKNEVDPDQKEANKKSIGLLTGKNDNVKRKTDYSLYWNKIDQGEKVYNGDSIRTGASSFATIQLYNSTEVELSENSLITLQEQDQGLNVKFKSGDMQTKSGNASVSIEVNNTKLNPAQNSELKLKTSADNKTEIIVQKGTATLKGVDNKTTELSKEKILKIDEKGHTESFELSITLNTPKDKVVIYDERNEIKYPFTWNVINEKIESQQFELSTDPKFPKNKTYVKYAQRAVNAPLTKGISYWRVGWKANNKLFYSETRTITVKEDSRIQLLQPGHQNVIQFATQDDSVQFNWKTEEETKLFVLEISKNREFTELVNTLTTTKDHYELEGLHEGSYWWRVQAFGNNNELLGKSLGFNFIIKRILPQLPVLKSPANGNIWTLSDPILFEWQPMPEAKSYRLVVSSDSAQKVQIKTSTQTTTNYLWKWEAPTTYYWSVEAINAKSQVIGHSLLNKNQISPNVLGPAISLISPENQSTVTRERRDPIDPVVFVWKLEKPLKGNFTLLISESPNFTKAQKKEDISGTRYALKLSSSANYYWKIVWQDADDKNKKEESSTFVLKFRMSSKIPAPILVEPLNEAKKYVAEKSPLDLGWYKVEGAENYHVVLERLNKNTKEIVPVLDKITKNTRIKTGALEPGTYRWYASSLDPENIEGPTSEIRTFTVEVKKELTAPKLNAPMVK